MGKEGKVVTPDNRYDTVTDPKFKAYLEGVDVVIDQVSKEGLWPMTSRDVYERFSGTFGIDPWDMKYLYNKARTVKIIKFKKILNRSSPRYYLEPDMLRAFAAYCYGFKEKLRPSQVKKMLKGSPIADLIRIPRAESQIGAAYDGYKPQSEGKEKQIFPAVPPQETPRRLKDLPSFFPKFEEREEKDLVDYNEEKLLSIFEALKGSFGGPGSGADLTKRPIIKAAMFAKAFHEKGKYYPDRDYSVREFRAAVGLCIATIRDNPHITNLRDIMEALKREAEINLRAFRGMM